MGRKTAPDAATVPIVRGLLAGAAGTAALDTVTYLDMAIRGRPASTTPERGVQRLADALHVPLDAGGTRSGRHRDADAAHRPPGGRGPGIAANRRTGLGALLGYLTGAGVAAGYAALVGRRLPWAASAALLTGAAMLSANAPLALLKITNPRDWSAADWLADVLPHVAYGAVTAAVLDRLR